jgi:hypothetical protein
LSGIMKPAVFGGRGSGIVRRLSRYLYRIHYPHPRGNPSPPASTTVAHHTVHTSSSSAQLWRERTWRSSTSATSCLRSRRILYVRYESLHVFLCALWAFRELRRQIYTIDTHSTFFVLLQKEYRVSAGYHETRILPGVVAGACVVCLGQARRCAFARKVVPPGVAARGYHETRIVFVAGHCVLR